MTAEPLTEEERRVARALWLELDRADYAMASPAQLLAFLRRCPEPLGLKYAQRLIAAQEAKARCFEADHDGLLTELDAVRQLLLQERMKVRVLARDATLTELDAT